ncbi:Cys-tRNA(Pro) deacylase [Marinospirillum perlucidum]|uniref:Cys-tRNA(Pro) deacylase n=1 Tax=Marinospirillum perlucidum TaxID=1982602 RepID=UPI000DF3804A|nr:Cys-tRNA(Pro) deacylase [Marinospirillum perlucidum]
MTPAVNLLKKRKTAFQLHEYDHEPGSASYGLEAAEKLGLSPEEVFKTLVAELDSGQLVVAILPVDQQLNLKKLAKAAKAKKASLADPAKVERTTGYLLGGVSPLGQKKALPTFIHQSAEPLQQMNVSGGRRGLEIQLAPKDLLALTRGQLADLVS